MSGSPKDLSAKVAKQTPAEYLAGLEREVGGFYSYPSFVCYLARESSALDRDAFAGTFANVAQTLGTLAGGPVYLADGTAFTRDTVHAEFPELKLFRLTLAEGFVESKVHPGIFIETKKFANLHIFSQMRREIRLGGARPDVQSMDLIRALLGMDA